MIFIYNNQLSLIGEIGKDELIAVNDELTLNGQITASFSTLISNHPWEDMSYFGYMDSENELYIYKILKKAITDNVYTIEGIHIFFHELSSVLIRDSRPGANATITKAITPIFAGTNWTVDAVTNKRGKVNFYYISGLDSFYQVIENFNIEFKPKLTYRNGQLIRTIVIRDKITSDRGKWYEYGDKLLTVTAEQNVGDIFTSYVGVGKSLETDNGGYSRKLKFTNIEWNTSRGKPIDKPRGQDYVLLKDTIPEYGGNGTTHRTRTTVVEFPEVESKEELLQKTYDYAVENTRPKVQLKATAYDKNSVELGEICTIIRDDMGIRYKTRIFKISRDLLNNVTDFEFGDHIKVSRVSLFKQERKKRQAEIVALLDEVTTAKESANGKNTVYTGENQPIHGRENDIWFKNLPNGKVELLVFKAGRWNDEINEKTLKALEEGQKENENLIKKAEQKADHAINLAETNIDLSVKKDNLIGQINASAGRVLLKASSDKQTSVLNLTPDGTFISTGLIKTAHISDGQITNAKISNLSASKITTGTLNASQVNIINLDANSITSNKTSFVKTEWNGINRDISIDSAKIEINGSWGGWIEISKAGLKFHDKLNGQYMGLVRGMYRNEGDTRKHQKMLGVGLLAERGYVSTLGIREETHDRNFHAVKVEYSTSAALNHKVELKGEIEFTYGSVIRLNRNVILLQGTKETGNGFKVNNYDIYGNYATVLENLQETAGIAFTRGGGILIKRNGKWAWFNG